MKIGIYPGSFDPVTKGHLDIIERSSKLVDNLIVGVLSNSAKNPMFSVEERIEMIQKVTAHIPNIRVEMFDGLLADFVDVMDADVIIRGLRAVTDFEYELQLAQLNRQVNPRAETIFLTTDVHFAYLSSSNVKEVAQYGGKIKGLVPDILIDIICQKAMKEKKS